MILFPLEICHFSSPGPFVWREETFHKLHISSMATYSGLFSTVIEAFLLIFKEYCVLYYSWGLFSIINTKFTVILTFKVISYNFEFVHHIFSFSLHVLKQW